MVILRYYENECVGCPPEMGCLGSSCPNINVEHIVCDICGEETKLYHYDGQEICAECILQDYEVVDGSE